MTNTRQEQRKDMKKVREKYFEAPEQIRGMFENEYSPFYQQVDRVAREEGLHFDLVEIREGMAGWYPASVEPVIYRKWRNLGEYDSSGALHLSEQKSEEVAILEPKRFLIRREPWFKGLDGKLRELYRIGYHIRKADEEAEKFSHNTYEESVRKDKALRVSPKQVFDYALKRINEVRAHWDERGVQWIEEEANQNLRSWLDISGILADQKRAHVREWLDLSEAAKKRIIVAPPNFDPEFGQKRVAAFRKLLGEEK
jgi:hypothetical protein